MIRSLDLFTGVGGFAHALRDLAEPVAYCEIDEHAIAVLRTRMADGSLPSAPICPDVASLTATWLEEQNSGPVDLITAGFPCQGFRPDVFCATKKMSAGVAWERARDTPTPGPGSLNMSFGWSMSCGRRRSCSKTSRNLCSLGWVAWSQTSGRGPATRSSGVFWVHCTWAPHIPAAVGSVSRSAPTIHG